MGNRDLFNKFTSGELDPKFLAEVDYEGYRKAARLLRNVLATPQGGVQRRFGTYYQATMMDGVAYITNIDNVRLIGYEYSNTEIYQIIIREDSANIVAFDIYLAWVYQTTVPAPADTYTVDMIQTIRWVKDYERLILVHPLVPPYELRRLAANSWELNQIQFQFFPTFDFSSSDDPASLPTPNTPYTSSTVTFTPSAVSGTAITLTANTAVYTSNHVGGIYFGNAGLLRITAINSGGTVATGYTLEPFADTSAIMGPLSALFERAWNDGAAIAGAPPGIVRGWPAHGAFYQSRLLMGGSPALQGTVYASNTREYYNFDDSESLPSFTYSLEVGINGNDVLADIIATKSIVLLSNKGSATSNLLLSEPTTPTNNFINTQGTEGSRQMNAIIVDNQILYADTAGNTIWSMSYDIPDTGYSVINASILSAHLIRNPQTADVFDPDSIDGRYYMLINSDGTMAVYNTIKEENIKAWTLQVTTGSFIDVACVTNTCTFLVRRKVNTGAPTGTPDAIYTVDTTFNAFRDITVDLNAGGPDTLFSTDGEYVLLGNEIEFTSATFTLSTVSSENLNLTYEYLNANGLWTLFSVITDTTAGMTATGTITWTEASVHEWGSLPLANTTLVYNELKPYYWMRIRRQNSDTLTAPISTGITINTQNRIYMENASFDIYMDCQESTTSDGSGNITGILQLAGQNAFAFANQFPLQDYYLDSSGNTTIMAPNAAVDIGLDYEVIVSPMPIVALFQNGWSVYEPTQVKYMFIDYYNSLGITIQDQPIPQVSAGAFLTAEYPMPTSGYYKVPVYNSWDARVSFIISQSYPAPFTLRGVSYTIEVSP